MTSSRPILPYGTWPSPIAADQVAAKSLRFGLLQTDGDAVMWAEGRPDEGGRAAIMRIRAGRKRPEEMLPAPWSARSRVHEYGGGEFLAAGNIVYFVSAEDQEIHVANGQSVERLTNRPDLRFAELVHDARQNRLIAIAERHPDGQSLEPDNLIVAIALGERRRGAVSTLVEGADFYAFPRLDGAGRRLAFIEWALPGMPWDEARLMVADLDDEGGVATLSHIAGGSGASVFQPEWAPDGRLVFVSDAGGWGNLMMWDGEAVHALCPREAEFGAPLWVLGTTSYALLGDGRIFATYVEDGEVRAGLVDPGTGGLEPLALPFRDISNPHAAGDAIYAIASADDLAPSLVRIPVGGGKAGDVEVLRHGAEVDLEAGTVSRGEPVTVERPDGAPVHALYYPPANAEVSGPDGETPPMIVSAHGGPTGMADRGLKLKIQYWTSRGFAFLDVDYGGSWGYGRAYREALDGAWGVRDVEDVIFAARAMVSRGLADGRRLLISGSSAGGFTVLAALTFHDVFAAGVSYYGIGDLDQLLKLTHKFESGYIYRLTGTEPGETEAVFAARSPLCHAGRISVPVFFFQGSDDAVVPPDQSRRMVESLKGRGVPVGYIEFDGEGHGFRKAETVVAALQAEYAFYARVLGLDPAETLPPVTLHNGDRIP